MNKNISIKDNLVNTLIDNCKDKFMFHGEVAMQLFINDQFELPSIIDICVERKNLVEVFNHISKDYELKFYNKDKMQMNHSELNIKDIAHITVNYQQDSLMNIFIYDVVDDEWIFRLDSSIRLPKNNIYFHSIKWCIDYIKPEIVLMYDLLDNQNYHQSTYYKTVIDALSYYQFVILKVVVGEKVINDALLGNQNKNPSNQ